MLSFLKRKPDPDLTANRLSALIARVSVEEYQDLSTMWRSQLSDEEQVLFFLEYSFFLTAVVDRLAHQKWGDPLGSQLLNALVDHFRTLFCRQSHFGQNREERVHFFESYFSDTFPLYARCDSIMGDSPNPVVFAAAHNLVEAFLRERPEAEKDELLLQTGKSLSSSLAALLATPTFNPLF